MKQRYSKRKVFHELIAFVFVMALLLPMQEIMDDLQNVTVSCL